MYFGSVRFFRHLILAVLVLIIAIPVFFAVRFGIMYKESVGKLAEVQAVVNQYIKSDQDQDELVGQLSELLSTSFDEQIPTFQQQVDDSVGAQIDNLYAQLHSDIKNEISAVKKDLEESISDQLEEIVSLQNELQQQIASSEKNQTAALEKYLNKKLEENETEIVKQINDSLASHLSAQTAQTGAQEPGSNGKVNG